MASTTKILDKLRKLMCDTSICSRKLDAYIVLSSDAHNSEYTASFDKRRQYISNFTGSAGTCVVTQDKALLWTDGRYYLQAGKELDSSNWTLMKDGMKNVLTINDWLCKELPENSCVGTDSLLMSYSKWCDLESKLKRTNKTLVHVSENLVDIIWKEDGKSCMPHSEIKPHPIDYCGVTWQDKVRHIRSKFESVKVDALVVSALDSIAWLLNMRGNDIMCCPVFKSYVILTKSDIKLFIHSKDLNEDLRKHLFSCNTRITIYKYDEVMSEIKKLAKSGCTVWMDKTAPAAFATLFDKEKLYIDRCPIVIEKAIKNEVEIEQIKATCLQDCAALCQYFGFLGQEIHKKYLTEVTAATELFKIRSKMENFVGLSFETISSTGPNAAIIHYNAEVAKSTTIIDPENIYLCDSGGQYLGGTTDITRTLHYGKPSQDEIDKYTLVLKGHIKLAMAVFPERVKGHALDVLARIALWENGLDYAHGTGHGIGCFLNVHEGPQCISLHAMEDHELVEGVLLSNEPGYYEDGKFGIRIENMIFVKKYDNFKQTPKKNFFCFETVSLVPMERSLINLCLLSKSEIDWLNSYHVECREKLTPILKQHNMQEGLDWLEKQTSKF